MQSTTPPVPRGDVEVNEAVQNSTSTAPGISRRRAQLRRDELLIAVSGARSRPRVDHARRAVRGVLPTSDRTITCMHNTPFLSLVTPKHHTPRGFVRRQTTDDVNCER